MRKVKGHRYLHRRGESPIFRRSVPEWARSQFDGRVEIQKSLGTSSLAEARHRLAVELAIFEKHLASAVHATAHTTHDAGQVSPLLSDIEAAVRSWLTERMSRPAFADCVPSENNGAADHQIADLEAMSETVARSNRVGGGDKSYLTEWIAEELIRRNGWAIFAGSPVHRQLLRVVGRGQVEAAQRQLQDLTGGPRRIGDDTFAPEQYRLDEERASRELSSVPQRLLELFDGYVQERQPKASTVKAWTRQLRAFVTFVGIDDARAISASDVLRWKDHLLTTPARDGRCRNARTVKDTYLSALKAVLGWAVENGRLKSNPAKQVRVRTPKKQRLRGAGLTDDEALMILRGTMLPAPARLTAERAFARRWVPWICAYTGARVNEITQLRRDDVLEIDGIWVIRITPEAGTVKSDVARVVPLHHHILDQGFLSAIEGRSGPLFYNRASRRGGSDENPQPKKVGEHIAIWVRALGVTDPLVQPNHGWRHRFKTLARLHGMDAEVRDAIQGHVPRTEGEGYGEFPVMTKRDAIRLLPNYDI